MDKQISGFGYCSATIGHTDVKIFQQADGKCYVSIIYYHSQLFDDFNNYKSVWNGVKEVENILESIYGQNG